MLRLRVKTNVYVAWMGLLSNKYQEVLIQNNRYHRMLYTNTVDNISENKFRIGGFLRNAFLGKHMDS